MSNIFLTVKDKFFAIRSKRFRYAFFALIVFIFIFLFSPLAQISVNRWNSESDLIKNSGKYDYVVNLPTHERYKTLKDKDDSLDENGKKNGEFSNLFENETPTDFDYVYVRRFRYYSLKNNFFLNIEVITPNKKFNQLVLKNSDSRLPKMGEGVLSPRFRESNKKVYPEKISIFDSEIKIVGRGLKLSSYSFGYIETLQVDNILKTTSPTKKLYEKGGWLYVTSEQFNKWVKQEKIVNYKNLLYLKMAPGVNHETVLKGVKDRISVKTNKFIADSNSFVGDINSGLKMTVNDKSLLISIIIFVFSFMSLLLLMFFLIEQEIKNSKPINKNLKAMGYSNSWISFSYTIHNFLFLVIVSLVAYFAGAPLYYFFSNLVLFSVNLDLTSFPFSIWGFLFFVFGLPFLWSFGVFLFGIYYIRRLFKNPNLSHDRFLSSWIFFQKIFMFLNKINLFSYTHNKIFSLFVLKNASKKLLVFLFSIFLIVLSFLLIFVKVSFDNYTKYQTSFVSPSVTSITEFEHTLSLKNGNKIMSNLDTFNIQGQNEKKFNQNKKKIIQNRAEFITEISSFILGKSKTSSEKFFHRDKEVKDMPFIKDIFSKNKFDGIYLGRAPYDSEKDFPALLLKSVVSSKKINMKMFKNQKFNSEILFMSKNQKQNINDYLKIYTDIQDRLPELKITRYGRMGIDKEGLPYILAPIDYRDVHGYEAGDLVKMRFKVNQKFAPGEHVFRIGGFIPANILPNSLVFADYKYLIDKSIVFVKDETKPIYNLIITRNAPKHFDRFAVLDVVRTRNFLFSKDNSFDFDLSKFPENKFVIANIKSLTLGKVGHLLTYHFQVFEVFFTMILSLNILFVFILLFLVNCFLFEDNRRMFVNLRSSGYKIYELASVFVIFFILQLLVAGVVAFFISYGIFNFVSTELLSFGVTLRIFGKEFYLLYMLAGLVVFLILMVIYQLKHFKKLNLTHKANY